MRVYEWGEWTLDPTQPYPSLSLIESIPRISHIHTRFHPHAQVWTSRLGKGYKVACIGETTATAAREQGWSEGSIFYPKENPGIDGWAAAVAEALGKEE